MCFNNFFLPPSFPNCVSHIFVLRSQQNLIPRLRLPSFTASTRCPMLLSPGSLSPTCLSPASAIQRNILGLLLNSRLFLVQNTEKVGLLDSRCQPRQLRQQVCHLITALNLAPGFQMLAYDTERVYMVCVYVKKFSSWILDVNPIILKEYT